MSAFQAKFGSCSARSRNFSAALRRSKPGAREPDALPGRAKSGASTIMRFRFGSLRLNSACNSVDPQRPIAIARNVGVGVAAIQIEQARRPIGG